MLVNLKKVWDIIKWPLLLIVIQTCILFLLCGYFEMREFHAIKDVHPKWSDAKISESVTAYLKSETGSKALGTFVLKSSWIPLCINACIVLPTIILIYQRHRRRFPRNLTKKNQVYILLSSIFMALTLNFVLMIVNPIPKTVGATSSFSWVLLLSTGIVGPLMEEFVFRGIVYDHLERNVQTYRAGIYTTILFAIYHMNPIQMIYAFILGYYFVYLMQKFENLSAPILSHIAANTAVYLLLPLFPTFTTISLVFLTIIGVFLTLYFMKKMKKSTSIYS